MNNYTYHFSPFNDDYTEVTQLNEKTGKENIFKAKLTDGQILRHAGRQVTSVVADLMDIGEAVLIADRFSIRHQERSRIKINLHIRNLEIFSSSIVQQALHSALYHFTDDQWEFNFQKYYGDRRIAERQMRIRSFARTAEVDKVDVVLSSGGLDGLGGICHQLVNKPNTFFSLVSIGTDNSRIQAVQANLANQLEHSRFGNRIHHLLINTPRQYEDTVPTNDDFRARAFVFLLMGAAYALLEEQTVLYVYENGIGAINLPFRASEIGLDHSRTVHPISLRRVQNLISVVSNKTFRIDNPFLFYTKAEICQGFQRAGLIHLITQTITCDRIGPSAYQCGTCSSCLLRRQALLYLGLEDTFYSMRQNNTHLRHMIYQVETLQGILDTAAPWNILARRYPNVIMDLDLVHSDLGLTKETLHTKILDLYERYVIEWQRVRYLFEAEMDFGISHYAH